MATKHLSNNEDDFKEIDELEDPEVPEMGEEDILTPKNPEETEFDDAELEGPSETMKEE